jgi:Acetyl-coenzyme A synthetase N-terminus
MAAEPAPIWTPADADVAQAQVTAFAAAASGRGYAGSTYLDLWRWSTANIDEFWAAVWEFFQVRSETPYDAVRLGSGIPGGRWFPGARLSYPEHILRGRVDDDVAIIDVREGEDGGADGVPDEVIQMSTIPRTLTGKRLEIPVKRILQGTSPADVVDPGTVDPPGGLAPFVHYARAAV